MHSLDVKTSYNKEEKSLTIDATDITNVTASYELVSKMRASFIVLGALVSRCKEARVALPGGCAIGERRVDFHIRGLEALRCKIKIENGYVHAKSKQAWLVLMYTLIYRQLVLQKILCLRQF